MTTCMMQIGDGDNCPTIMISINLDQFKHKHVELIDVTGETDEEFHSRKNSFINRLFGIEKTRKESTWVAGKIPDIDPIRLNFNSVSYVTFQHYWNWTGNTPSKIDKCYIFCDTAGYILHGVFPEIITSNGNAELRCDLWTQNEDVGIGPGIVVF